MKGRYQEEAEKLAQAIDIAIDSFVNYPPQDFLPEHVDLAVSHLKESKDSALLPLPEYKNLKSLSYLKTDVLTFFQEASGPTVEEFWKKIKEVDLPFERVNLLEKTLKKKRIKDYHEYNYVIDTLVPFQQDGLITCEQAEKLNGMIAEFEERMGSKA